LESRETDLINCFKREENITIRINLCDLFHFEGVLATILRNPKKGQEVRGGNKYQKSWRKVKLKNLLHYFECDKISAKYLNINER